MRRIFVPQLDHKDVAPILKRHKFKLPENVERRDLARWYYGIYYGYGNRRSWFPLNSMGGISTIAFMGLTVFFPKPVEEKLLLLLAEKKASEKAAKG